MQVTRNLGAKKWQARKQYSEDRKLSKQFERKYRKDQSEKKKTGVNYENFKIYNPNRNYFPIIFWTRRNETSEN